MLTKSISHKYMLKYLPLYPTQHMCPMLKQRFPTYTAIKPHGEIQANYKKQVEAYAAHQSEQESQKSKDIS